VTAYGAALFIHLLSLLLACVAATLAMYGAFRLRRAESADEARSWMGLVGRVVPLFPVAVLGLFSTGAFMTHARWSWSLPWVQAGLAGLAAIVALGSGVEGSRGRALRRELEAAGLSPRARRLLRDPVSWTAKLMTQTLAAAVLLVMTVKPGSAGATGALATALVVGALGAVPFWRSGPSTIRPAEPALAAAEPSGPAPD